MKANILMMVVGLMVVSVSQGQIKNAKTEIIKVYGKCDMCKANIEKAGGRPKLFKTVWNVDTRMATITYDGRQTSTDAVLKSIALSGYDNENYLAPDDTYSKLPGCCQYEREKKGVVKNETAQITDATTHLADSMRNDLPDTMKINSLKAVFEGYFSLMDALVKTDGVTASASASAMFVAIHAVDMNKLNPDEHTIWMAVEKKLIFDAQQIRENTDPKHQRMSFMSLSATMYDLVKAAKPAGTVYYQFCPMANDGKGASWLSKESAIKNPYYGSQMLSCGKTIETIKY